MNATHTPGPWRYHLGRGAEPRFHIQTKCGYQIGSTTALNGHKMAREENEAREANARLLSAAPELLEALQELFKHCAMVHSQWGDNCNRAEADAAIKMGRAAITKATGIEQVEAV